MFDKKLEMLSNVSRGQSTKCPGPHHEFLDFKKNLGNAKAFCEIKNFQVKLLLCLQLLLILYSFYFTNAHFLQKIHILFCTYADISLKKFFLNIIYL